MPARTERHSSAEMRNVTNLRMKRLRRDGVSGSAFSVVAAWEVTPQVFCYSVTDHFDRHHRQVIEDWPPCCKRARIFNQPVHHSRCGKLRTFVQETLHAVMTIFFVGAIARFRKPISIKHQAIALLHFKVRALVAFLAEHSDWQARRR